MKKWMFVVLAMALLTPVTVLGQHSSKAAEAKPAGSKASTKAVTLSGQISLDGTSLVSEENEIWNVSNANVLAGHEGQQVSVKCRVLPDKNEIHVLTLKVALTEVKYVSNRSDSAFRR